MSVAETLDRVLDPVADCLSPEVARAIVGLRADPAVQAKMDVLAEKNTAGRLTPEERSELEGLVQVGNLIAVLQAKSRRYLQRQCG